jgi:exonuclease III
MNSTPEIHNTLKVISFNLHGFNQGCSAINDLIESVNPDIFLLQEHWLTPSNLNKFDTFKDYFTFGCSAMANLWNLGCSKVVLSVV